MSKVRIVNWLLTRRCNLKCDYCAITKNYENMPSSYPPMSHYIQNEMTTKEIISALTNFKIHNPEAFHILYGGEPMLRKDLPEIINFCNLNDIHYTIISNNTPEVQPMLEKLFKETNYIKGFTSSVDPVFGDVNNDRVKKSIEGLRRLKEIQTAGKVNDVVAEITIMNNNQHLLKNLVEDLSQHFIYSDITFVDIAKNSHYDFSNIHNEEVLVKPSFSLAKHFVEMLQNKTLLIHMKDILLPMMYENLPSKFDCEIEKGVHNITIDADGSSRLCLRIRGEFVPKIHMNNIFDKSMNISEKFQEAITIDKYSYCNLCNHSCLMMSKFIDEHGDENGELIHIDKRGG